MIASLTLIHILIDIVSTWILNIKNNIVSTCIIDLHFEYCHRWNKYPIYILLYYILLSVISVEVCWTCNSSSIICHQISFVLYIIFYCILLHYTLYLNRQTNQQDGSKNYTFWEQNISNSLGYPIYC